uniref:EGF-like domain-containing protein n=1 Tax=Chrysemys picta bellii TaxID=8478 RepID=A0A8C3HY04_CHRPI
MGCVKGVDPSVCVWGEGEPLCTGTTEDCNNHLLCPANAKCVNNTHCTCLDGYQSHGNHPVFFTDTTEICDGNGAPTLSGGDCGPHANCTNVPGNYSCTCSDGYESSSGKANFTHASENTCQDIDECQRNTTICEPHGTCINMPGSYMCKCSWGFGKSQKDPSQICTDINECRKTPGICGPKATCINTYGSYWCKCRAGYVPSTRNSTMCEGGSCRGAHGGDSWGG